METLLKETIRVLREYDKTPADVKWCGSKSFGWFTWDEFALVADSDYGFCGLTEDAFPKVATDLVVVGDKWWLERYTCHEREWWEFKSVPRRPEVHRRPLLVINDITNRPETLISLHDIVRKTIKYIR